MTLDRCRLSILCSRGNLPREAQSLPTLNILLLFPTATRQNTNAECDGRSGSKAGSYIRLIDCVYHSTLGMRIIKKKQKRRDRRTMCFFD